MFPLTEGLKSFARQHLGVAEGAGDDVYRQSIGKALANGSLTGQKFAELSAVKAPTVADVIAAAVEKAVGNVLATKGARFGSFAPAPAGAGTDGASTLPVALKGGSPNPVAVMGGAAATLPGNPANVRVKGAHEWYENTRKEAIYPDKTWKGGDHLLKGRRAVHGGVPMHEPSELDRAIAGSWFKFMLLRNSGVHVQDIPHKLLLSDHDKGLIQYAMENCLWSGQIGGDPNGDGLDSKAMLNRQQLPDWVKAPLIDDSTSGGLNIVPNAFDDALVLTPVLYGELYPLVNVVPMTRGNVAQGGKVLNPTMSWGTAEGTSFTPFDATSFVSAFNTTIYPIMGALETGLDFLEDSPAQIGQVIVDNFGRKYMEALDNVVATGSGSNQPLGIFNTAGVTALPTDNNVSGPPTVSDYESLVFGVTKAYRTEAGARGVFVGNDTSYQRARGVPVSPTDQRRVFGLDQQSYSLFNWPYKVNASISNSNIAFVMMNRYRLYRRLGLLVRIEQYGQTLGLKNTKMIIVRARLGGQLEQAGAMAMTSTAQA